MSTLARWTMTEIAEVKPLLEFDAVSQKPVYGPTYQIKCDWRDKAEARMSPETGEEFVTQRMFSTEAPDIKMGDLIKPISDMIDDGDWQRVRLVEKYPMTMFGRSQKPDFEVAT